MLPRFFIFILLTVLHLSGAAAAYAGSCPNVPPSECYRIGEFLDFNCDHHLRLAIIGDSIVYGRGDDLNGDQGGYALRIDQAVEHLEVFPLGYPGITTDILLRRLKQDLPFGSRSAIRSATKRNDLIVVDVGRNDFWAGNPPELTARNIKRIVVYLRETLSRKGVTPLVVAATLIPNLRTNVINEMTQHYFVEMVNNVLLQMNSADFPVLLRFDRMPESYLQRGLRYDAGLHPTSGGYNFLAHMFEDFLYDQANHLWSGWRKDADRDDLFDICESVRYHTNPSRADTDGDGYLDGDEVYRLHSNPLMALSPAP